MSYPEGYSAGLADFQSVLSTFTQSSRLRVIAELKHGDRFHPANIISSIEFHCDDELFAIAGVSRRIKIFDFSSEISKPVAWHRFGSPEMDDSDEDGESYFISVFWLEEWQSYNANCK
ncbi:E3 UBIQUITIN-PROTEIN LIGASE COP1 [Salix purpurea]|uniref:E3 UBIQUITIN-PROTEIN LIGASE COP1 n=1 Tax=Salix purpurea TaxID=77065 RepID=A0A9Q0PEN9_SALPP|nr:E3 UBIQUITIN-PROTEIN LIGASE COP1 [Salix purpurea]